MPRVSRGRPRVREKSGTMAGTDRIDTDLVTRFLAFRPLARCCRVAKSFS